MNGTNRDIRSLILLDADASAHSASLNTSHGPPNLRSSVFPFPFSSLFDLLWVPFDPDSNHHLFHHRAVSQDKLDRGWSSAYDSFSFIRLSFDFLSNQSSRAP